MALTLVCMSDDHLIEHRVHQEELLRGRFLHAFRDTVRLPNQSLATREYVVHPGAVMVIPLLETPEGLKLVLERQYRYPVGQVMIEFPAGKLDSGEDPWLCAQRELQEETGLVAVDLRQVFRRQEPDGYITTTFVCKVSGQVNTSEAGLVRWITPKTLFAGPFGSYNVQLWKYLGLPQ